MGALPRVTDPRLAELAEQALAQLGGGEAIAPWQRARPETPAALALVPPETSRRPAPRQEPTIPCPVGWCLPDGRSLFVHRHGELCCRHTRYLSRTTARRLELALQHPETASDVIRGAVLEVRQQDQHWYPFGVTWRWRSDPDELKVEGHRDERRALRRACWLDEVDDAHRREGDPSNVLGLWLIRTVDGFRWSGAECRTNVEHDVHDETGRLIASGPTLGSAWCEALVRERETAMAMRPSDSRPLPRSATNKITGRTLSGLAVIERDDTTWSEVEALLRRTRA